MSGNSHDTHANSFSPEGRIFQIEYAMKSIDLSSTVVAILTKEGIVFGAERRITSPLKIQSTYEKILQIDDHALCCVAGYVADSKLLISSARAECQNHRFTYDEYIPLQALSDSLSDVMINFGKGKSSIGRPFGCALIIGGYDGPTPQLYSADPSGTVVRVKAKSIGAGAMSAQQTLSSRYNGDMSLAEATLLLLEILRDVMESAIGAENVELAVIKHDAEGGKVRREYYEPERISALIEDLPAI